jgi:hypothetical protein
MGILFSHPLPHRGRGQGEGACNAQTSVTFAPVQMQYILNHRALRRPLTPTLSPQVGEGVVFVRGSHV